MTNKEEEELENAYRVLVDNNIVLNPIAEESIETILRKVKDKESRKIVQKYFKVRGMEKELFNTFKKVSDLIYQVQISGNIEDDEFTILNKISEHAIVALSKNNATWLRKIYILVRNGMRDYKEQMAKGRKNELGTAV